jgi:RimJ/RimL family protein N-acetyltransferase
MPDESFTELAGERVALRRFHPGELAMRCEGHLRESTWAKGEWTDDLLYAVLDHEWQRGG